MLWWYYIGVLRAIFGLGVLGRTRATIAHADHAARGRVFRMAHSSEVVVPCAAVWISPSRKSVLNCPSSVQETCVMGSNSHGVCDRNASGAQ